MGRYLKAAFLVGVDVPGLGRLPVNVLAVAAIAIFGAIEPSLWLAGGGLEAAFLASLAFSPRFQKLTDGLDRQRGLASPQAGAQLSALVAALPPDLHFRLSSLHSSSARVLQIYQSLGFDEATTEATRLSLDRLEWLFLKLLIARNHLEHELNTQPLKELEARIARLTAESTAPADPGTESSALVRSREATLDLLRQRAENLRGRDRLLAENASDLDRIEAQVELMREKAAMQGKPFEIGVEIDLASDLATDLAQPDLFGAQTSLVHALDRQRA
jgi:hypothetical protein